MYDISGEFLKSPEAMLTVQTDSDCVASFKDTKQNVDSAWQSARALWTVQVSDSIDKESSLSDRVAIIAGGIKEVYSDKKVCMHTAHEVLLRISTICLASLLSMLARTLLTVRRTD